MKVKGITFLMVGALAVVALITMGATQNPGGSQQSENQFGVNPPQYVGYRPVFPYEPAPTTGMQPADSSRFIPASLDITLSPGQEFTEDKTLYLPERPIPKKADILWCFDLTGSMVNEVDSMKVNSLRIMNALRTLIPDSDFGVISHTDYPGYYTYCNYGNSYGSPGDYAYSLDQSITANLTDVANAINGLSLGAGNDGPESYARALYEAYADPGIGWRTDSKKFIIQWGDNIPHDCNVYACVGISGITTGIDPGRDATAGTPDDLPIMQVIDGLSTNNICLLPLHSGSHFNLWNCFAQATGCSAFVINSDGTIPGGVDIADYIYNAVREQFEHIDTLIVKVCTPGFENWLINVNPPMYTDIDLQTPQSLPFSLTFKVPDGTAPGTYCFDVCAYGDGALYATQHVCITVPGDCLHFDIGDVIGNPNEEIWVPITVEDVTGWNILAFEGEICWCDVPAGLIQFDRCESGPVFTNSGWDLGVCNPCNENCISFAAAGATPLVGEGILFYLVFHISANAKPCMCCDLDFTYLNVYDDERTLNVCLDPGSVCIEWCDVAGCINYWKCCLDECGNYYLIQPLAGIHVTLTDCDGNTLGAQYTSEDGCYEFSCLEPIPDDCFYCVTPSDCPDFSDCVTPYDAALVLRYAVCLDNLDDCTFTSRGNTVYPQRVAADVNCSDLISAMDASLILQYAVGLIDAFPCPDPWVWFPTDDECVTECPATVDWIGVFKGDVSGCPDCPRPAPLTASETYIRLGNPIHYDNTIEIPVLVKQASNIFGVKMTISYPARALMFDEFVATGLASGCVAIANDVGGQVVIGIASAMALNGNGEIGRLKFKKKKMFVAAISGRVLIQSVMFNEGTPTAVIQEPMDRAEIYKLALGPVRPNPFAKSTSITFSVPTTSKVTISIYSVTGQHVSTIVDEAVSPGRHAVVWDGTDSNGNAVAKGVYFVHMRSGAFQSTERIVLLR